MSQRPPKWITPQVPARNIITQVDDDLLTCTIDLRCPGAPSKSSKSLLIANSKGWRSFVGSGGCEILLIVRKPLLGAHPDELMNLGDRVDVIHDMAGTPTLRFVETEADVVKPRRKRRRRKIRFFGKRGE